MKTSNFFNFTRKLAPRCPWVYVLTFLLALPSMTPRLQAGEPENGFEAANILYDEGKYGEATAEYDNLIATGNVSPALYFNRGNALFKLGHLGRAIASYRQAQHLSPRDPAVLANLQFARTRARGGSTYHLERWRGLLSRVSLNEWTVLTALAFWALFIQLAIIQWQADFKPRLRNGILTAGFALVIFGTCLGINITNEYFTNSAVVIIGEAEVHNGPLDEAPSVFKVRDGTELEVVDQKDNWLQVVDSAQRTGWVRQDEIMSLAPTTPLKTKS